MTALPYSAAELLDIFENAPLSMLLVDEDRRVRRANRIALDATRFKQDEIVGLRSGEALKCIHTIDHIDGCGFGPDCRDCTIRKTVVDTFSSGKPHKRVASPLRRNKDNQEESLYILISTMPLSIRGEKLVLVCVEDVTDLKQAEQNLRISEERYALAQRAANIGSWDWNIATGDLEWSDKIEPMFGFAYGAFEGTYEAFLERVHPDDRQYLQDSVNAAVKENADYDIEHRIIWPDGTTRWVSETGQVFRDENGEPVRMLGIVRDITERKKADSLKDEFIGLVSHELRSPLTVIIGAINTVLSEWDYLSTEETKELIGDASVEAESLSHLIGNLVELSRSRANRLIIYPEPVAIDNIAETVIEAVKRLYPAHRFTIDIPSNIPPVRADQLRLERILYNLLENSAKYSSEQSEIRITANIDGNYVIIGVSDQGTGLSVDEQKTLFDSFQRLARHEESGIAGSGLGLSVCRVLTEAHGGRIWVESETGKSTTFFFSLPWQ